MHSTINYYNLNAKNFIENTQDVDLQKNMQLVYDSARRQGYEIWNYSSQRNGECISEKWCGSKNSSDWKQRHQRLHSMWLLL